MTIAVSDYVICPMCKKAGVVIGYTRELLLTGAAYARALPPGENGTMPTIPIVSVEPCTVKLACGHCFAIDEE